MVCRLAHIQLVGGWFLPDIFIEASSSIGIGNSIKNKRNEVVARIPIETRTSHIQLVYVYCMPSIGGNKSQETVTHSHKMKQQF